MGEDFGWEGVGVFVGVCDGWFGFCLDSGVVQE